jgi:hypothetical protein
MGGLAMVSGSLAMIFGLILGVAVFYCFCRLVVLSPVVAIDGVKNPITAIMRSWELTKGSGLQIFLSVLVFVVLISVLMLLLFLPFGLSLGSMAQFGAGGSPGFGSIGLMMLGLIAGYLVILALLAILGGALMAVIHAETSEAAGHGASGVFA